MPPPILPRVQFSFLFWLPPWLPACFPLIRDSIAPLPQVPPRPSVHFFARRLAPARELPVRAGMYLPPSPPPASCSPGCFAAPRPPSPPLPCVSMQAWQFLEHIQLFTVLPTKPCPQPSLPPKRHTHEAPTVEAATACPSPWQAASSTPRSTVMGTSNTGMRCAFAALGAGLRALKPAVYNDC